MSIFASTQMIDELNIEPAQHSPTFICVCVYIACSIFASTHLNFVLNIEPAGYRNQTNECRVEYRAGSRGLSIFKAHKLFFDVNMVLNFELVWYSMRAKKFRVEYRGSTKFTISFLKYSYSCNHIKQYHGKTCWRHDMFWVNYSSIYFTVFSKTESMVAILCKNMLSIR